MSFKYLAAQKYLRAFISVFITIISLIASYISIKEYYGMSITPDELKKLWHAKQYSILESKLKQIKGVYRYKDLYFYYMGMLRTKYSIDDYGAEHFFFKVGPDSSYFMQSQLNCWKYLFHKYGLRVAIEKMLAHYNKLHVEDNLFYFLKALSYENCKRCTLKEIEFTFNKFKAYNNEKFSFKKMNFKTIKLIKGKPMSLDLNNLNLIPVTIFLFLKHIYYLKVQSCDCKGLKQIYSNINKVFMLIKGAPTFYISLFGIDKKVLMVGMNQALKHMKIMKCPTSGCT